MIDFEEVLVELAALHDEVDRAAAEVAALCGGRLRCGPGCAECCVDDLTVFEVEAERLRRGLPADAGPPHPPGACALLDPATRRCRAYAARPYVCRTQGLPLRWLDDDEDEVVERRDICPVNDEAVDLLELEPEACWALGPFEGRLAELQRRVDGGVLRRVRLRDLLP